MKFGWSWLLLVWIVVLWLTGCANRDNSNNPPASVNQPPQITALSASPQMLHAGSWSALRCRVSDPDLDSVQVQWSATWGEFESPGPVDSLRNWQASGVTPSGVDTLAALVIVTATDRIDTVSRTMTLSVLLFDSCLDTGEPFIDMPDEHGVFNETWDPTEPWVDIADSNGINNYGVWDPWDPYQDLNGDGNWDRGEFWFDLPSGYRGADLPRGAPACNGTYDGPNGQFDDYELFTWRAGLDSGMDRHFPVQYTWDALTLQPQIELRFDWLILPPLAGRDPGYFAFIPGRSTWTDFDHDSVFDPQHTLPVTDADIWFDTGEPFVDLPDTNGVYNGEWDPGEIWFDLPSSFFSPYFPRGLPTTNGVYDGPNGAFDEYELFTSPYGLDPRFPIYYTWEDVRSGIRNGGRDWVFMPVDDQGRPGYLHWINGKSTWTDCNGNDVFEIPHFARSRHSGS